MNCVATTIKISLGRVYKKPEDVKDEPGAEERFTRGLKRALETPPKPHDEVKAERAKKKLPKRVHS
jgi:hypothetical protein